MAVYYLCEAANDKPDSQVYGAPNRYCAAGPKDNFPPLALRKPMQCIKTGATQVILAPDEDKPNTWKGCARPANYTPHYPNVDVFTCPNCNARVAVDEKR